jgi:hypothetical protein
VLEASLRSICLARWINFARRGAQYLCTDAVAVSTFVSDYYLRHRGVEKACVIPLDKIEGALRDNPVDLGINVHTFFRMPASRDRVVGTLAQQTSRQYLMVVPNPAEDGRLLTDYGRDFLPLLERYGYRHVLREPKFGDSVVQEYELYPSRHHLLELGT